MREELRFRQSVREAFAFLEARHGMSRVQDTVDEVAYESPRVRVRVVHARLDGSIEVRVALRGTRHDVEVQQLAVAAGCTIPTEDSWRVAGSPEAVSVVVRRLASLLAACHGALAGSQDAFLRAAEQAMPESAAEMRRFREACLSAEIAWRDGRHEGVVEAWEPWRDRLQPSQAEKLQVASRSQASMPRARVRCWEIDERGWPVLVTYPDGFGGHGLVTCLRCGTVYAYDVHAERQVGPPLAEKLASTRCIGCAGRLGDHWAEYPERYVVHGEIHHHEPAETIPPDATSVVRELPSLYG